MKKMIELYVVTFQTKTLKTPTGTIIIFYIKCVKGCGILFRNKDQVKYIEPKENELYIFPSNLDHYPLPSTSEELRISCNMNLMCKESINELFDEQNLFTLNHIKR